MAATRPLRADAARNRDKLLAAATKEFSERGLDVPLEHIARRAAVSIGTLYAHFPTREAFFDAIFPVRLAQLETMADTALADPDPWHGFVGYLEATFALQANDRGLSDALVRQYPRAVEVSAACHRGATHIERILARAKESGQLRADFEMADMTALVLAMSRVIRETPDAWQRFLAFFLDGLRAAE